MPLIFEPTAALLAAQSAGSLGSPSDGSGVAPNGGSQVWIAASPSGASPLWGGCQVWLSFDNTTYGQIGTITSRANQGVLTAALSAPPGANPDTTDTLGVDLSMSGGALPTGSDADAQAGRTLCYVGGELIAYGLATPTTGDAYNLTDLYRGLYGSTGASHASGAAFVLLDDNIFRYNLPTAYAGQTLYFKFASFNSTGGGVQDLSSLTAVSYTPSSGIVPSGIITGGDATLSSAGVIALATTGVTAGSYTYGSFTADAKGRLTAASNGTTPLVPANNLSDVANAATARGNLVAAKSGANSDITSLTGLTTALAVSQGGTGQSSFADGQLLIGDSTTNGLDKASLTAGSNIAITNGHGTISIAATVPTAANPTATAGASAVNGSATTFMRSDAAPAIPKASSSQFGIVEVDNITIKSTSGVIANTAPNTTRLNAANVISTSSGSPIMCGLGLTLTPSKTGNVVVVLNFLVNVNINSINTGVLNQICYGTGTPPSNGAANAGTAVGNQSFTDSGTITSSYFSCACTALITGLSIGTSYWFDLLEWNEVSGGGEYQVKGVGGYILELNG